MVDTLYPIALSTALATLSAVLDVCGGIPGANPRAMGVPFLFPEVGAAGNVLPNGDIGQNTRATLTYDVISIVGLGSDEWREEYDPDADLTETEDGDTYEPDPDDPEARLGGIVANVSGNRIITVQVRCEVTAADAAGPHTYLERVRTRLGLPSINARLETVGLAVADILDTRPANFTDGSGREVRAAFLEIVFNAADVAEDDVVTTIQSTEMEQE